MNDAPDPFVEAGPARKFALTVRFVLELCLLAGAAAIAWHITSGGWRWLALIVALAAIGTLWGMFLSPKAAVKLPGAIAFTIEAILFCAVGVGLFATGLPGAAIALVVAWALDRAALAVLP